MILLTPNRQVAAGCFKLSSVRKEERILGSCAANSSDTGTHSTNALRQHRMLCNTSAFLFLSPFIFILIYYYHHLLLSPFIFIPIYFYPHLFLSPFIFISIYFYLHLFLSPFIFISIYFYPYLFLFLYPLIFIPIYFYFYPHLFLFLSPFIFISIYFLFLSPVIFIPIYFYFYPHLFLLLSPFIFIPIYFYPHLFLPPFIFIPIYFHPHFIFYPQGVLVRLGVLCNTSDHRKEILQAKRDFLLIFQKTGYFLDYLYVDFFSFYFFIFLLILIFFLLIFQKRAIFRLSVLASWKFSGLTSSYLPILILYYFIYLIDNTSKVKIMKKQS